MHVAFFDQYNNQPGHKNPDFSNSQYLFLLILMSNQRDNSGLMFVKASSLRNMFSQKS